MNKVAEVFLLSDGITKSTSVYTSFADCGELWLSTLARVHRPQLPQLFYVFPEIKKNPKQEKKSETYNVDRLKMLDLVPCITIME